MLTKRINPADLADAITNAIGSWNFIIWQSLLMVLWFALNTINLAVWHWHWDAYPFVFLNLFMSMEAAYATPIILMSGNRQQIRDESQREADRQTLDRIESIEQTLDAHVNGTAKEHSQQLEDLKMLLAEVHGHITAAPVPSVVIPAEPSKRKYTKTATEPVVPVDTPKETTTDV